MNRQVAVAQLSIVDGAWQEAPDNLAVVDGGIRGTLYVLVEVAGEADGRDALARELVETTRREYTASHGSITFALTQAVRVANTVFFNFNLNLAPESRRIGGITAVVLREDELFIAQAGPGLTCVVRDGQLQRYPAASAWFDPSDVIGDFVTPGAVPLGLRHEYTPDLFHVTLQPGDTILLSTRTVAHLLSNDELLDTLVNRHPDEIVDSLEDIAGAADLAAFALQLASDAALYPAATQRVAVLDKPAHPPPEQIGSPVPIAVEPSAEPAGLAVPVPASEPDETVVPDVEPESEFESEGELDAETEQEPELELEQEVEGAEEEPAEAQEQEEEDEEFVWERADADEEEAEERRLRVEAQAEERRAAEEREAELQRARDAAEAERRRVQAIEEAERRQMQAELARERRAKVLGGTFAALAGIVGAFAGIFGRIDLTGVGAAADRAISTLLRAFVQLVIFAIHAFLPGTPDESRMVIAAPVSKAKQTAWRLLALLFPVLLLIVGGTAWVSYRNDVQKAQKLQLDALIKQGSDAIDAGKRVSSTDKAAAREWFGKAISLAQQARKISPSNPTPSSLYYQAQDLYDGISGISVLFLSSKFATFSDAKTSLTRLVAHLPDVYILDRGLQRVYRYSLNDTGTSAAPVSGDGVILKTGDKIGERTIGDLVDILWIDAGRLVALDRNGVFLQFDPVKSSWTARAAADGTQWARVTMAASYVGNLYLLDPTKNQIWKYVATAEGVWSSSVSYFAPGVNVDLSTAVDMAIDGDLWVLRADGSIWRFSAGKLADFGTKDLDTPLSKPTSLITNQAMVGIYIADGGNQRIVQFDKVTGKFVRQFKPRSESRNAFDQLKLITADEPSKKFFIVNGNQMYLANIPQ